MRRGFSLIELSIVLVILGLLTGGILAGKSLIRAGELRAVGTEYGRYKTATLSFRDRYFAVPGDFTNATMVWGKNSSKCNGQTGTAQTTGTCNGDGDGMVAAGATPGGTSESFQFWHQLDLAGLIEGQYTGTAGTLNAEGSVLDTNSPASKFSSAGWTSKWLGSYAGGSYAYAGNYGHYFLFGATDNTDLTVQPIMTPEEAWNIDTKLDDGKPATGKIVGRFWNNACSVADSGGSTSTNLVASYKVNSSTTSCGLYFREVY